MDSNRRPSELEAVIVPVVLCLYSLRSISCPPTTISKPLKMASKTECSLKRTDLTISFCFVSFQTSSKLNLLPFSDSETAFYFRQEEINYFTLQKKENSLHRDPFSAFLHQSLWLCIVTASPGETTKSRRTKKAWTKFKQKTSAEKRATFLHSTFSRVRSSQLQLHLLLLLLLAFCTYDHQIKMK